ncbi:hypothetical protein CQS04_11415 [Chryseomicrobium excrementi]|uniref:DUF3221 domain-containing protein n=1 Tax=Chryseomicrobium excrementi TaxID=2041346 RepID=A0A2M9EXA9_9BACL|nr:DUF3221 domain-containing protein [Chryseomicrobium excrementi]PJK15838.1 hypothetical protein CQS04_11415 [Chryseomicrobium excrementi]
MSGKKLAIALVIGVVVVVGLIMTAVFAFFANNPTQQGKEGSNEFTGYVLAIQDDRMLVVSGTAEEIEGVTPETILDSGLPAIWFSVTLDQKNKVQVGDEVRVTHEAVAESYPGQSAAVSVEPTVGLD